MSHDIILDAQHLAFSQRKEDFNPHHSFLLGEVDFAVKLFACQFLFGLLFKYFFHQSYITLVNSMLSDECLLVDSKFPGLDPHQSHPLSLLGYRFYFLSEVVELIQHLFEQSLLNLEQITIGHCSI